VFAHDGVWKEYSYLGGMDAIALGCVTALLVARVRFSQAGLRVSCGPGLVLVGIVILGAVPAGIDMSVIAIGACMIMIAAAQAEWRRPRIVKPLLMAGQRSYEVYLTHMFVVFVFFDWFVARGKPMAAVPALFVVVIVVAVALGEAVGRFYSEPMNRYLRTRCTLGNSDREHGNRLRAVA
jgi:peptidoglycan/LPS O-acetylase OafA/YrhL